MRLDEVTGGRVYVDVNIFYMYLRADPAYLPAIRRFFARVVYGEIEAHTSALTMDELFYRLLLARVKEVYGQNPLDVIRERAGEAITRCGAEIENALWRLMELPHLRLVGVVESDVPQMLINVTAFGLLPRDALHVAVIQRLGLSDIVTDDVDFDRVPWLQRHWLFNAPVAPKERDE